MHKGALLEGKKKLWPGQGSLFETQWILIAVPWDDPCGFCMIRRQLVTASPLRGSFLGVCELGVAMVGTVREHCTCYP